MTTTSQDEWDAKAAELLPCGGSSYCMRIGRGNHRSTCPADYRPAVAAALREAAEGRTKEIMAYLRAAAFRVDTKATAESADVADCYRHAANLIDRKFLEVRAEPQEQRLADIKLDTLTQKLADELRIETLEKRLADAQRALVACHNAAEMLAGGFVEWTAEHIEQVALARAAREEQGNE